MVRASRIPSPLESVPSEVVVTTRVSWRRVLGEGTLIVVSILLGLSIDAWWDDRQEAQLEAAILAALRDEVIANRTDLKANRAGNEDQLRLIEVFLRATPEELARVSQDSMGLVVRALARPLTFDPRGGAAALLADNALLSSDGIRVRTLVTEWRTRIADSEDEKGRFAQRANDVQERLARYAVRTTGPGSGPLSQRIGSLEPRVLAEIRADPSVVEAVVLKSAIESVYLTNLIAAEEVQDSLVEALGLP